MNTRAVAIGILAVFVGGGIATLFVNRGNGTEVETSPTKLAEPQNGKTYPVGANAILQVDAANVKGTPDSVVYYVNGKRVGANKDLSPYNWPTAGVELGIKEIIAKVYTPSGTRTQLGKLTVASDVEPAIMTYTIVKTYPHDTTAFTEGLEYHDGFLYESTGEYNESDLRKTTISTGVPVVKQRINQGYFGEGLTLLGDKIYQLTYQEKVGIIYDANFVQKSFFDLSTKEGWGLTNDGTHLIQSDGTYRLTYLDPASPNKVVKTLNVADKTGIRDNLNELEWVNGVIYANIWRTDNIVKIDAQTGKIIGVLNLAGLLKPNERGPRTDVLNGIAYDAKGDRFFVTGKRWPKLYEIKIK